VVLKSAVVPLNIKWRSYNQPWVTDRRRIC